MTPDKNSNNSDFVYDRYREPLTFLGFDANILAVIRDVGLQHSWWAPKRTWTRKKGQFNPDTSPFIILLFETSTPPQDFCAIEVFQTCPSDPNLSQAIVQKSKVGWLRLTRFPEDSALPSLPCVLKQASNPTVVSYHLHNRCTIKFSGKNNLSLPQYAKVLSDDRGERIYNESRALWNASRNGRLEFSVASPISWDRSTKTLWQNGITGISVLVELSTEKSTFLAGRMGRAAASLTCSGLRPSTILDGAIQVNRLIRDGNNICCRVRGVSKLTDQILGILFALHKSLDRGRILYPIHGALRFDQWLNNEMHLGLVDFDQFALGDREFDVATFLTGAENKSFGRDYTEQIKQAFVAEYESVAGPLNPTLIACYCIQRHFTKALHAAKAVNPDSRRRVKRHLKRALLQALSAEDRFLGAGV